MPQAEFEPANTASGRSLTHALERAATEISNWLTKLRVFNTGHSSKYLPAYLYCATSQ